MRRLFVKYGVLMSLFTLAMLVLPAQKAAAFSGSGAGTLGDPYQISDCDQWLEIADELSANYKLINDVDCASTTYTGIGDGLNRFTGTIDGNLFTIKNVTLSGAEVGLIGWLEGATVRDLRIDTVSLTGSGAAAGLSPAATSSTVLTNIHVTNATLVSTNGYTAGLINFMASSSVDTCSVTNSSISANGHPFVAGIAAQLLSSQISNCYSDATLDGNDAGGLAGITGSATITNSYSAVTFSVLGSANGGLVGDGTSGVTIEDSFSVATMPASGGSNVGGIIGAGSPTLTNVAFDQTRANRSNCSGSAVVSCTVVNTDGSTPDYFKDSKSVVPINAWSFGYGNPWRRTHVYPQHFSFDDADGDGVTDSNEMSGPNGGDANGDSTPDYQQSDVAIASDVAINNGNPVVVSAASCDEVGNVQLGNESAGTPDASHQYPAGIVGFYALNCGTAGVSVPVSVYFYGTFNTSATTLRKYVNGGYVTVTGVSFNNLTIGGLPVLRATYTVVDGGPLDDDNTADGNISDPVGLATAVAGASTAGAPDTGLATSTRSLRVALTMLGTILLLAACAIRIKRKI